MFYLPRGRAVVFGLPSVFYALVVSAFLGGRANSLLSPCGVRGRFGGLLGRCVMPDGKRKRRFSANLSKRRYYAAHRARRFARRFGFGS